MPGIIILIGLLNITDVDVQFCCYGQESQSVVAVNDQISHIPITNYELRITNRESRITNYESRITNHESRITNHESRIKNWIKPCLITAGIGLIVYGLYRIRGR